MRQSRRLDNGSLTRRGPSSSRPRVPISRSMQRLKIDQVEAGMVLAGDVQNERGMILCGKGTPLSETLLRRMKSAGIDTVPVQGHPEGGAEATMLAERIEALHRRFERTAALPLMAALRDICERQLMRRYGPPEPAVAEEDEELNGPAAS